MLWWEGKRRWVGDWGWEEGIWEEGDLHYLIYNFLESKVSKMSGARSKRLR